MNPKKTPLSIRIIYWLTNVILGLAFIICAAAIAINVLIFSNLIGNEMQLHTELPAKVDFSRNGTPPSAGYEYSSRISGSQYQDPLLQYSIFSCEEIWIGCLICLCHATVYYLDLLENSS